MYDILDRTAVCMHYLTHASSTGDAAAFFGVGKATALRFCRQVHSITQNLHACKVINVIIRCLCKKYIALPSTQDEWDSIALEFEKVANFPNAVGAIDGTLIEIERPTDHEGNATFLLG
jgi:hypothetical protein